MVSSFISFVIGVIAVIGSFLGVTPSQPANQPPLDNSASTSSSTITGAMHSDLVPDSTGGGTTANGASKASTTASLKTIPPTSAKAILAGGCFWSTESDLEKVPGVLSVTTGYTGGTTNNPTYGTYKSGGHREAVEVTYDPTKVSYAGLVEYLLKHTDPTDSGGTFYDRGDNYRAAVYYRTDAEKAAAERVIRQLDATHIYESPIVAPVLPAATFWPAEEYHQDYAKKNPEKYNAYRVGSGRAAFIERHWGANASVITTTPDVSPSSPSASWKQFVKPSQTELKRTLSALAYHVTQEDGTEPAFNNAFFDNKHEGIYVDIVSGEPLFSSKDKYDSGTGWPSFTKPLVPDNIVTREDRSLLSVRTEVRSKYADSHLGHVFNDGPRPLGLRYCMNSAAMRFIPKEQLVSEGYGEFASLFQ